MKRIALLFLLTFAHLFSGVLSRTVSFFHKQVNFRSYQGYDVVELSESFIIADLGKPSLPLVTFTFVIPPDAQLSDVVVKPVVTEKLPGRFNILPAQPPMPISQKEVKPFVPPEPAVYSSDEPFPNQPLIRYSTGNATGFTLASITLCPFEYHPRSGELLFHTQVEIAIYYKKNAGIPITLAPLQKERTINSLRSLVANPEQLLTFSPPVKKLAQPQIDYLVITTQKLASWFASYLEYRNSRGLKTEIRTTEWIEHNFSGRDIQEKIRNLIINYFQNRGLSYVLLAGDNQQVPSRRIRLEIPEPWDIPTDLYFGDLNYSWDSNHNNLFGEMADSVDFYADVFVGRISVEDSIQVYNFIDKVKTFENNPAADYIKRSLLPSGWLWRSVGYHGKFVNDSIANITPSDWIDRKMENPPNAFIVADSFNNGFALFDPAGHGNEYGVYDEDGTPIYTSGVASNQHNERRYTIVTSLACNPGNFEAEDCLAEVVLNCPQGGAIGVMMNSRYGWGTPPYIGPSELLCIRFYDFLFNCQHSVIGPCHDRSREQYVVYAQGNKIWRWCFTEFNLLGDPTIDIWTEPPVNLTLTASDTILTGSQTLPVAVYENGSPASGAVVTAYKNNDVFARAITNIAGEANLTIRPLTTGELKLTATRHNNLPVEKIVFVKQGAPEPVLIYQRYEIDDSAQSNPNRILEPGETAVLKLTFSNIGLSPATNINLTLSTVNPDISISDSTTAIDAIPPNDSVQATSLIISARSSALPGSNPELFALVHSDQGEYGFWFSIDLGYSGRTWGEIDTGICALTVTARGTIGFDIVSQRQGKGFRYPKSDTTGLNIASFCLGNSEDYLVDRFYNQNKPDFDQDWRLQDSLRVRLPLWNTNEFIWGSFNDGDHHHSQGLFVEQVALGLGTPGLNNFVILIYDIQNTGNQSLQGLYAGILADFDVKINDRFHDIAFTLPQLNTAVMRNILFPNRYFGIKLLYPPSSANLTCVDHSRYVYPDSAMTDGMKLRALNGTLGLERSDRPYNWSIGVATGPFDLLPHRKQRLAFAFIATSDSISYISSCSTCQNWFNTNVGIKEEAGAILKNANPTILVSPNPFTKSAKIRYSLPGASQVGITAFDITGRKVATLVNQTQLPGSYELLWQPKNLAQGVYFIKLQTTGKSSTYRCLFLQ